MRSSHNTPSIVQMLALMLSARLSPTSNFTNSVAITEMAKFMNETKCPLRRPLPSRFAILVMCLRLLLFLGHRLSLLPRLIQIVLFTRPLL
ncbi:hypothetical protein BGY98DRAFT_951973 [Russula aff. rugulosa BPL654]|nr:hypothetical protein BGY98DRAFT_951973 [Russula aff. rugulosa BPL654]